MDQPAALAASVPPAAGEPGRWETIAAAGLILLASFGAVLNAFTRGPWFDEFWTLWVADFHRPLGEAYADIWMHDAHPPLFAFGARLLQVVAGESYIALRLANLIPLAAFLAALAACWRWAPRARAFLLAFTLLWLSSLFFVGYFAEGRSYFAQHGFGGVFMIGMVALTAYPPDEDRMRKRLMLLSFAGLLFVANLHFLTAAICGGVLVAFIAAALLQGRYRLALALIGGGALAYAPLVATSLPQIGFLTSYAADGNWVARQTLGSALREFGRTMWRGAGQNLPAALAALVLGGLSVRRLVGSKVTAARKDPDARVVPALLTAWLIISAALLAIDQQKPFIVGPYLLGLSLLLDTVIALAIARAAMQQRWLYWMMLACAAGVTGVGLAHKGGEPNWLGTIRAIEADLKSCPSATVWAATWPRERQPELEKQAFPAAYRYAARIGGFEANLRIADHEHPTPDGAGCGAYLWLEHLPAREVEDYGPDVFLTTLGPAPGMKATFLIRTKSGVVIKLAPAS